MSADKVLVTGASGFIGSHCVLKLLERGYSVRGTIRSMSRAEGLKQIIGKHTANLDQLEFVEADLLKDKGWDEAVGGCKYVLHVASPVPVKLPKHEDELIKPAKDGTLRVLKACIKNDVKRLVLTSSIAAICYGHKEKNKVYTEADWSNIDGKGVVAYPKSKTIAERSAWDYLASQNSSLEMTAVNPSVVFGPALEKDFGSSLEIVRKLMAGEMPGAPKIAWPIVDVRDVAEMELLAMTSAVAPGNRYICANDTMWISEIGEVLKRNFPGFKKKISTRTLPNWLVKVSALFDPAVKSVITELDNPQYVSSEKAKRELGWSCRSNEEAIIAAAKSLMDYQIVK